MALRFATFLIGLQPGLDELGREAECTSKKVAEDILRQTVPRWRSDTFMGPFLPPIDPGTRVSDWANAVAHETSMSVWWACYCTFYRSLLTSIKCNINQTFLVFVASCDLKVLNQMSKQIFPTKGQVFGKPQRMTQTLILSQGTWQCMCGWRSFCWIFWNIAKVNCSLYQIS